MSQIEKIIAEVEPIVCAVKESELDELATAILGAGRVFVAGAGRSGLMIRAFANRLMHLGIPVGVVGEVSCPHTRPGDLLIVGSGSGETGSLVDMARRASLADVRVALVTCSPSSTIASMADVVVTIPAQAKGADQASVQPMASSFEQSCLLTYDALVLDLMERTGETGQTMYARHADLE
jgi:6-phospho-3-hexuloisomerase